MKEKVVMPFAAFLVLVVAGIAWQEWKLGEPWDAVLSWAPPSGTNGIVSVLTLIAAAEAVVSSMRAGRLFLHFSFTLAPTVVVLYGGLWRFWHVLPEALQYATQAVALLLAMFVAAGASKKIPGFREIGMDKRLHAGAFWSLHVIGGLLAIANLTEGA